MGAHEGYKECENTSHDDHERQRTPFRPHGRPISRKGVTETVSCETLFPLANVFIYFRSKYSAACTVELQLLKRCGVESRWLSAGASCAENWFAPSDGNRSRLFLGKQKSAVLRVKLPLASWCPPPGNMDFPSKPRLIASSEQQGSKFPRRKRDDRIDFRLAVPSGFSAYHVGRCE